MIRDVLAARLAAVAASNTAPDYQLLAREVLGIRGASATLARQLVEQALVVEDRRDHWRRIGERVRADAPHAAGVYVFRDADERALYVGKAANLRRRLHTHFADRRWRTLHPAVARVARVDWQKTGSELEALLIEATLIAELQPAANVHVGEPAMRTRAVPRALVRDVAVLLPSIKPDAIEIVAARARGEVMLQRVDRSGATFADDAARLWKFFDQATPCAEQSIAGLALAPLVFSWIAGRGRHATRLDPHDAANAGELAARLAALVVDTSLFVERLVHV
jgi:predicted GIY-YIG superfamily endonuclease